MHVASDGRERKARICRGSVGKKSYFIHKMSRIQNGGFFLLSGSDGPRYSSAAWSTWNDVKTNVF